MFQVSLNSGLLINSLPDENETRGYLRSGSYDKVELPDQVVCLSGSFRRRRDNLELNIDVVLSPTKPFRNTLEAAGIIASSPAGVLKDAPSISGRKLGQRVLRLSNDLTPKPFYYGEVIVDGQTIVTLRVTPVKLRDSRGNFVRDSTGERVWGPVSIDDWIYAENHAKAILERLTVLGLTSRPKESASALAKQQMKERANR